MLIIWKLLISKNASASFISYLIWHYILWYCNTSYNRCSSSSKLNHVSFLLDKHVFESGRKPYCVSAFVTALFLTNHKKPCHVFTWLNCNKRDWNNLWYNLQYDIAIRLDHHVISFCLTAFKILTPGKSSVEINHWELYKNLVENKSLYVLKCFIL